MAAWNVWIWIKQILNLTNYLGYFKLRNGYICLPFIRYLAGTGVWVVAHFINTFINFNNMVAVILAYCIVTASAALLLTLLFKIRKPLFHNKIGQLPMTGQCVQSLHGILSSCCISIGQVKPVLTQWGWGKMVDILQTIFSMACSWMKLS